MNSKGLAFFLKKYTILHKMLNLGFCNFCTECTFYTFFVLMHGYLCEFILALLIYGDKGVRVLARLLLGPKLLRYVRNLQWAQNFIFPIKNIFIPIH